MSRLLLRSLNLTISCLPRLSPPSARALPYLHLPSSRRPTSRPRPSHCPKLPLTVAPSHPASRSSVHRRLSSLLTSDPSRPNSTQSHGHPRISPSTTCRSARAASPLLSLFSPTTCATPTLFHVLMTLLVDTPRGLGRWRAERAQAGDGFEGQAHAEHPLELQQPDDRPLACVRTRAP